MSAENQNNGLVLVYNDNSSAELESSAETEISDESLEAVAGGVTVPKLDGSSKDFPMDLERKIDQA